MVKSIPEGYASVTPYLTIKNAAKAIDFYKQIFGAKEEMRMEHDGKVGHAELRIGNSKIMLCDEWGMAMKSPQSVGGSPIALHLYVDDVDNVFKKALAAGAKEMNPVKDQFYGDRSGCLTDPFGHVWYVATHVEDVSEDEMRRRADAAMKEMKQAS